MQMISLYSRPFATALPSLLGDAERIGVQQTECIHIQTNSEPQLKQAKAANHLQQVVQENNSDCFLQQLGQSNN